MTSINTLNERQSLTELQVISATAGQWKKLTCQLNGLIMIYRKVPQKAERMA
jgi:hypothetical protein